VLHTDVIHTSESTVQSSQGIIEHHTFKSYEKMQAELHAFQTGQYEHDGFLLTLNLFANSLPEAQNQSEAFDVQSTAS